MQSYHIEVLALKIFDGLFGEFNPIHDEESTLSIAREQEPTNQRGAQEGLAGARGHFEQELP